MKKLLILSTILAAISIGSASAQTYTSLASDPMGDPIGTPTPDIKAVSYSMNKSIDKIWFKVELHNSYTSSADFGMMIAIDTNKKITDGASWSGPHKGMKYDHALFVYQNSMFPTYYGELGTPSSGAMVPITVTRPDNFTFVVETKLSTLDNNGDFNLLIGTGGFDISSTGSVYDDAPHTGYLSIPVAAPSNKDIQTKLIKPALNGEIVKNKPFELRARLFNKSTSVMNASERVEVTVKVDGVTVLKDTPTHAAINGNDSIDLVVSAMKLSHFTGNNPNSNMCVELRALDFTDPSSANNSDCRKVSLRLFPSGIDQVTSQPKITLYPNPASDQISIKTPEGVRGTISLNDLTGKQVFSQPFNGNSGQISLEALSAGLYLYQIADSTGAILDQGKLVLSK